MRGRNGNLAAKAVLAFEGAGECDFRMNGGCLGENVSSMDEVSFDLPLEGGLDVDGDESDNNGSKPTGTRFKS